MAAVAVQCIADDVARWISATGLGCAVAPLPTTLKRHSSDNKGNADVFVAFAANSAADFARAVVARLRLERPELRISIDSDDERRTLAAASSATAGIVATAGGASVHQSAASVGVRCVLVALSSNIFECPVVLQEIASCLPSAAASEGEQLPRLAFVYNVRSGRGQDPTELFRQRAPSWMQIGMERLATHGIGANMRSLVKKDEVLGMPAVPIFEYLHEYDDLCVSAFLQWYDARKDVTMPNSSMIARLRSSVRSAASVLSCPQTPRKYIPEDPQRTFPPVPKSSQGALSSGFTLSVSAVKSSAPRGQKLVAVGFLYDPNSRGAAIARDAEGACALAFGASVRTADVGERGGVPLESVANLLVIITPGVFRYEHVMETTMKAVRSGGTNILLLQDVCSVPNIWDEFEALPSSIKPAVVSTIAVPYLRSHGFSACLARLAGTELLRPIACAELGNFSKPAASQYGRASSLKLFDLFLCHFQRTGLDWAFAMRLGFVQHAGMSFRTFLDVQSLQNVNECGRFVEQSHALAVLVTPGIFTRAFCQRELLFARRAGVQVIFIQHIRSCIDIDEEVRHVRMLPVEFMSSSYGVEYARAGGTEADFARFQDVFFNQIWTQCFRPPVFAYIHELESVCVQEIVQYLRNRRAHRSSGVEQLDRAARALLEFLRLAPEDRSEVRAGLTVLANQAASGNGDDFCSALVRVKVFPMVAEGLRRHGINDASVAHQAFRALRVAAATSSGQSALQQFIGTSASLITLHKVIVSHVQRDCDEVLKRETLEMLRALRNGDALVQLAVMESGLRAEFDGLFRRLRAELEPLDEIREQLDLAPVQLPQLEFALSNWSRQQGDSASSLPCEVERASNLLRNVRSLREAVSAEDGKRVDELLHEHLPDVERCAGVEALLREARRLAEEFRERKRLLEEQVLSEEGLQRARRSAQDRLEDLISGAVKRPMHSLVKELEEAIVAGHELKCTLATLEQARTVLDEMRCVFETPAVTLKSLELAPANTLHHINPAVAVLALMSHSCKDRALVLRCLDVARELVEQEATAPSLIKRVDVEVVHRAMEVYTGDIAVQTAACKCVGSFLQATRNRYSAISSRALVEHPNTGDIVIVKDVVEALGLQQGAATSDALLTEATCTCLAELARCGGNVIADIKRFHGLAHIWRILKSFGLDGRYRHRAAVASAVKVFEELARFAPKEWNMFATGILLKCCDIYDCEVVICTFVLQSLVALFSERPELTAMLVGCYDMEVDTTLASGSKHEWSSDVGLSILLRNMRIHSRDKCVQEYCCLISGIMVKSLINESASNKVIPSHLLSKCVDYIVVALRLHLTEASVCSAALVTLATLVDFWEGPVCAEVVELDGVVAIVNSMESHSSEDKIQQCGLKLLSVITRRYPRQTLGESRLRAIVNAMRSKPQDALTQVFGCAALRSLSEQNTATAEEVGTMAADVIFAAMESCQGHVPLHEEALRVIELAAAARPEVGYMLGVQNEGVLRILLALGSLLPAEASSGDASPTSPTHPTKLKTVANRSDTCVTACRTLRALCAARAASGMSFDRLFHRGVCRESRTIANALQAFPGVHDVQLEALQLLHEAVLPDNDGALLVGDVLAQMGAAGNNVVLAALQLFHMDSDCVVIFGLLSRLAACHAFVASFVAVPGCMMEVLRWTAIFRDDACVQQNAVDLMVALLNSSAFDPSILVAADGVEALFLAAARHHFLDKRVPEALLGLASRCRGAAFYTAIKVTLERHVSNGRVVGTSCSVLCAILEGSGTNCLQHVVTLRQSGALHAVLAAMHAHRGDRSVVNSLPQFICLTLRDTAMRELLLESGVASLLMDVLQGGFRDSQRRRRREIWLEDITPAARRMDRSIDAPAVMAAGFRALQCLMNNERMSEIVSSDLISILLRALAVTQDDDVQRCAVSLLAAVLHFCEQQLTWTACGGGSGTAESNTLEEIALAARHAHSAEMEGLRQWRSANQLVAAAEFRTAAAAYETVLRLQPDKMMRDVVSKHLVSLPLKQYIQACELQHSLLHNATREARTTVELSPSQGSDDCAICLQVLVPRTNAQSIPPALWRCDKCTQWMHERCVSQWREHHQSCPLCRQEMGASTNIDSFKRTKAVAEAAMKCIAGEGARVLSSGQSGNVHCKAFLALSVAALWRASVRVGMALGVPSNEIEYCDHQACILEAQTSTCQNLQNISHRFEEHFVQPCEEKARERRVDAKRGSLPLEVMQGMAVEVLQRRCAALGEEAAVWEEDVTRLEERGRFGHAEQLLMLISVNLSGVVGIADDARLRNVALRDHLEQIDGRRKNALALRDTRNAEDTGHVAAAHRERRPLTYFGSCLGRPWERSSLHLHVIICMRAVAAAARASRVTASQGSRQQANQAAQTTARGIMAACGHVIHAIIQDGLPGQVATYLTGERNRLSKLAVVAFFQQFLHCGQEAKDASFTHLDIILSALAAPRHAQDTELQTTLCSLAHDLVFGGGCEERMVMRLQREASPRAATSLEEWFLDTLLVQHGAEDFREQIQQPSQADAWLSCTSPGVGSGVLGTFFASVEGEGLMHTG